MVNETLLIRVYEEVLAISNNAYLISKFSENHVSRLYTIIKSRNEGIKCSYYY